ncbi:MAG: tRNA uridine-5-carboxymethylaminomethyl(34) synthesis GTPase MnmE [Bacteroidales bacterium]|nr:tRNA uridine-5-carboxymethylaminomethyl(34) synthesis GTPase MnmE [Bacteroidales bacterium]
MQNLFDNTICAPATAPGGAIAVIRVSGLHAIRCVDAIFSGHQPLSAAEGYSVHFGAIHDDDGCLLDEVIVTVFRAPHSYTGENSVEISCHGSGYIVSRILSLLIANGAKMASPGEFTQRAFLHGKMDLSQAEAVADLIASRTAAAHRIAVKQMKGGFSKELALMREQLLQLASLMELELDFSEEEVEFADRTQLRALVEKVLVHCGKLISSFTLGNAIKNGVPVAIVGNINAGKSTLLNAILGEDRAIVSDIAGTTRDTIEETYDIAGVLFRFIDTAGLRESDDTIERIGIERALEKIAEARLVLATLDLTAPLAEIEASARDIASRTTTDQQLIFLLNKADAVPVEVSAAARKAITPLLSAAAAGPCEAAGNPGPSGCTGGVPGLPRARHLYTISAKSGIGLQDLRHALASTWRDLDIAAETSLVTNTRHLEALQNAAAALSRVRDGLDSVPTDLLAQDLRESLHHLGSIVGEVTTDEVLGNIFGRFCIGK